MLNPAGSPLRQQLHLSSIHLSFQNAKNDFEVFTYNQSTNYIMNEDDNEVSSVDATYTWDDRNDDWWDDYSNYENINLICGAQGGRPEPTFIWYIDNNKVTWYRVTLGPCDNLLCTFFG